MTTQPIYIRPSAEEVQRAIDHPEDWLTDPTCRKPANDDPSEWDKDHHGYFIAKIFPVLDMALDIRQLVIEAYLSYRIVDGVRRSFEQDCDGSTLVPDSYQWGRYVKDWQGTAHDYTFWLHHKGLADAFGRVWGYWASNNLYRRAWLTDGRYFRSVVWWIGLNVGSWPRWCGWV